MINSKQEKINGWFVLFAILFLIICILVYPLVKEAYNYKNINENNISENLSVEKSYYDYMKNNNYSFCAVYTNHLDCIYNQCIQEDFCKPEFKVVYIYEGNEK